MEKIDGWLDEQKKIDGWSDRWIEKYMKKMDGWMDRKNI